jgi:hypothetical protein
LTCVDRDRPCHSTDRHDLVVRHSGFLRWQRALTRSRSPGHRYVTPVTDLERSRVLFTADDQRHENLDTF